MRSIPLDRFAFGEAQTCFGCGPHHTRGLQMTFAVEGEEVVTRVTPDVIYEGPPGMVHGGIQSTLADELAAWTLIGLRGRMGFTFSMQLRLLRPARLGVELVGRGRVVDEREGAYTLRVAFQQDGKTTLTGKVIYVVPTIEAAERTLGRSLPEVWRRFARDGAGYDARLADAADAADAVDDAAG